MDKGLKQFIASLSICTVLGIVIGLAVIVGAKRHTEMAAKRTEEETKAYKVKFDWLLRAQFDVLRADPEREEHIQEFIILLSNIKNSKRIPYTLQNGSIPKWEEYFTPWYNIGEGDIVGFELIERDSYEIAGYDSNDPNVYMYNFRPIIVEKARGT